MKATREVRRVPCTSCGGTGIPAISKDARCERCCGRGWVRTATRGEIICSECKGFRRVRSETPVPCEECEGHGFIVQLLEVITTEKQDSYKCSNCDGNGYFTVRRRVNLDECERCDGTGADMEAAKRLGLPLEDCPCPDCKGGEGSHGVSHEVIDCRICKKKGTLVHKYIEREIRII